MAEDFGRWIAALDKLREAVDSINPPPDPSLGVRSEWERALMLQTRAGKKPV